MPKIRSIKPTFWSDSKLGRLPRDVRYTFLGLIAVLADDEGRLIDNAKLICANIYPFDDDVETSDVETHLGMLVEAGRVVRYSVEGEGYIAIVNWARHQKIDHPAASLLPSVDAQDSRTARAARANGARTARAPLAHGSHTIGEDGRGEDRIPSSSSNEDEDGGAGLSSSGGSSSHPTEARVTNGAPPPSAAVIDPRIADAIGAQACQLVWTRVNGKAPAYFGEMTAALDGMHGFSLTPQLLGTAVNDWLVNDAPPNLRLFRGYLRGALPKPGASGGGASRTRTHADRVAASRARLREIIDESGGQPQ